MAKENKNSYIKYLSRQRQKIIYLVKTKSWFWLANQIDFKIICKSFQKNVRSIWTLTSNSGLSFCRNLLHSYTLKLSTGQRISFFHRLTQNMTRDLNPRFWKKQVDKYVLFRGISQKHLVILISDNINWWKNQSLW